MADVISLKDGSTEVIFQPKDFHYLIEKHMGYDAADYFEKMEKIVDELQEEADYTAAKVNTDLESYESSLESNTACFQEILEVMEQIKSILEAPRINKKKLFNLVEQVEKEIKNQI